VGPQRMRRKDRSKRPAERPWPGHARVVVPQFDRAHMRFGVAAEKDDHAGQDITQEDRAGDCAAQAFGPCCRRASEVGAVQLAKHDRVPVVPSASGQAFGSPKAHLAGDRTKNRRGIEETTCQFQQTFVFRRYPDLRNANECPHERESRIFRAMGMFGAVSNARLPGPART